MEDQLLRCQGFPLFSFSFVGGGKDIVIFALKWLGAKMEETALKERLSESRSTMHKDESTFMSIGRKEPLQKVFFGAVPLF